MLDHLHRRETVVRRPADRHARDRDRLAQDVAVVVRRAVAVVELQEVMGLGTGAGRTEGDLYGLQP